MHVQCCYHCWRLTLLTQEKIVRLTRDVKDAHEVIAEGKTLETKLNQRIKELEREKKNLMVT